MNDNRGGSTLVGGGAALPLPFPAAPTARTSFRPQQQGGAPFVGGASAPAHGRSPFASKEVQGGESVGMALQPPTPKGPSGTGFPPLIKGGTAVPPWLSPEAAVCPPSPAVSPPSPAASPPSPAAQALPSMGEKIGIPSELVLLVGEECQPARGGTGGGQGQAAGEGGEGNHMNYGEETAATVAAIWPVLAAFMMSVAVLYTVGVG